MTKRPRASTGFPKWLGKLDATEGTIYLAIVDRMEAAINSGELRRGDALPTHRELASALEINVGTVTRAYAEAKQRGLIGADRRRGSFVLTKPDVNLARHRRNTTGTGSQELNAEGLIDLTTSRSASKIYIHELSRSLKELSCKTENLDFLQEYFIPNHPFLG